MRTQIITCPQWKARAPKEPPKLIGKADRIILHHTASHMSQIDNPANESVAEAIRYARDIQAYHMDHNGWNDSGHNFLVTRGGHILQGRWYTVTAIEHGHMVVSAHCPGQNTQIGIEHEHWHGEQPTPKQLHASALLQTWIALCYKRRKALPIEPHRKYFATSCPENLIDFIPAITREVNQNLKEM